MDYEETPRTEVKSKKLTKEKTVKTAEKEPKIEKTIKVKTLIIAISVVVALIVAFIGGMVTQGKFNDTVRAQAVELSKQLNAK